MTDSSAPKRILRVSPDSDLLQTQVLLLKSQGYKVDAVTSEDEAMSQLRANDFDWVLLGRNLKLFGIQLDDRNYPKMLTLKIQSTDEEVSLYASRTVDAMPQHVIDALKAMFSQG